MLNGTTIKNILIGIIAGAVLTGCSVRVHRLKPVVYTYDVYEVPSGPTVVYKYKYKTKYVPYYRDRVVYKYKTKTKVKYVPVPRYIYKDGVKVIYSTKSKPTYGGGGKKNKNRKASSPKKRGGGKKNKNKSKKKNRSNRSKRGSRR